LQRLHTFLALALPQAAHVALSCSSSSSLLGADRVVTGRIVLTLKPSGRPRSAFSTKAGARRAAFFSRSWRSRRISSTRLTKGALRVPSGSSRIDACIAGSAVERLAAVK
jgi:hypothetical protein